MSDEFIERYKKRTKESMDAIIKKTKYDRESIFTDPVDELIHHPMSLEIATKSLTDSELTLLQPLGIDFTQFRQLKKLRIRPAIPPSYKLMKFIIYSMKQKIQGLAIVSKQFFSNAVYIKIHTYYKKAKNETDYSKLKSLERIQARLFWQNIKKYAQRRGIPFKRRLYRKANRKEIDLLNHRLNIVGNRLRKKTLETIGMGKKFFKEIEPVHKIFSSLDSIEAIRPILYFVVIRSLSLPFSKIRKLVDNIIELGIQWTNNWIASMISFQKPPKKLSYYNLCNTVNSEIRKLGIFRFQPFTNRKVTGYYSMEEFDMLSDVGIVYLENQTKEQKAGERVHGLILSKFPQPITLPKFGIIAEAAYLQVIAETLIRNEMDTYRGKPDLLIFGDLSHEGIKKNREANLMLIVDIKTYDSSIIDIHQIYTSKTQVYQIEQYCKLLKGQNYNVSNAIKTIIHIDRQNIPKSFIEFIWMVITNEIEDLKDQAEYEENNPDFYSQNYDDEIDYYDITIVEKGVKITFWK